jgi:predicted nucleic acid-binding protein
MKGLDPQVVARAHEYDVAFGRFTISVVTVMEVVRGLQKKQAVRQLQAFRGLLPTLEILSFDQDAADAAGCIEGDLGRVGRTIGRADPMIAAVALRSGLEIVTGNQDHYRRIRDLGYPLVLRDWRE